MNGRDIQEDGRHDQSDTHQTSNSFQQAQHGDLQCGIKSNNFLNSVLVMHLSCNLTDALFNPIFLFNCTSSIYSPELATIQHWRLDQNCAFST